MNPDFKLGTGDKYLHPFPSLFKVDLYDPLTRNKFTRNTQIVKIDTGKQQLFTIVLQTNCISPYKN